MDTSFLHQLKSEETRDKLTIYFAILKKLLEARFVIQEASHLSFKVIILVLGASNFVV